MTKDKKNVDMTKDNRPYYVQTAEQNYIKLKL